MKSQCEKKHHFVILSGGIIKFYLVCEKRCSLLRLAGTHLCMKIYNVAFQCQSISLRQNPSRN